MHRGRGKHPIRAAQQLLVGRENPVDWQQDPTYGQPVPQLGAHILWGSDEQPFWRPGANPTVDMVLLREAANHEAEVLLIRRADREGVAERGKWALPGGFHDTDARQGEFWRPGKETARQAALRELAEETGMEGIDPSTVQYVGYYAGNKRDTRDNEAAWAVSNAYTAVLEPTAAQAAVEGRDDADAAEWVPVAQVGELAFDHQLVLLNAVYVQAGTYTAEELQRRRATITRRAQQLQATGSVGEMTGDDYQQFALGYMHAAGSGNTRRQRLLRRAGAYAQQCAMLRTEPDWPSAIQRFAG